MRCLIKLFITLLIGSGLPAAELRVAVAQPLVVPGDIKGNIDRMAPLIKEAADRRAELIVFSECAITGYDLKGVGARSALSINSKELKPVAKLAHKNNITIIAGFHEKDGNKVFNSAGIFYPDGKLLIQRKHNVMESEKAFCPVQSGERKRVTFEINKFKCAILICADSGIPGIHEELAAEKCDAIITITAGAGNERSGFHQSELSDESRLKTYLETALPCIGKEMVSAAIRLNIAQIACNQCGWHSETEYFQPGGSAIIDHTGETVAVILPRFVFEHIKPDLAVGKIGTGSSR